jgi:hypothetical protein
MKILEFEELRSGKTIAYYAKHVGVFGIDHLINPYHDYSFI